MIRAGGRLSTGGGITNEQLLTIILSIIIPLGGLILVQSRSLRRDMAQLESRLESRIDRMETRLSGRIDGLDAQIGDLRDRLGRIEDYLDLLREFWGGSGRGTVA